METVLFGVLAVLALIIWLSGFRPTDTGGQDTTEDLSASPSGGRREMLLGGVIFPLAMLIWGGTSIVDGKFTIWWSSYHGLHHQQYTILHDRAVAMGIGVIALGLFFHFHWFWGLHPKLYKYIDVPKMLSMLTFVICLGYTLYSAAQMYR